MQVPRDAAKQGFYYLHVHDLISFSNGCHFIMLFVKKLQLFFFMWERGWGYLVTFDQLVQDNYIKTQFQFIHWNKEQFLFSISAWRHLQVFILN